jgi:hypothetical protein
MKDETLGNSQAFASIAVDGIRVYRANGLTKREYFAAMAMQGISANASLTSTSFEKIAEWSVKQAEALITELNNQTQQHDTNL